MEENGIKAGCPLGKGRHPCGTAPTPCGRNESPLRGYLSGSVAGTGGRMEGSTPASGGMVIGVCMSGKEKGRSPGALPPGEE